MNKIDILSRLARLMRLVATILLALSSDGPTALSEAAEDITQIAERLDQLVRTLML